MGIRRPGGPARSMTRTRSIGARSDWSNGGDDDDDHAHGGHKEAPSRTWSIYKDDADASSSHNGNGKPAFEDDPDDPINKYVADQLARITSNESREFAEELTAQNDGANDEL